MFLVNKTIQTTKIGAIIVQTREQYEKTQNNTLGAVQSLFDSNKMKIQNSSTKIPYSEHLNKTVNKK